MHQNIIKFEDYELRIDFLNFSIPNFTDEKASYKIASYLKKHPHLQAANDFLFGTPKQDGYATFSGSNSGYRSPTQLEMGSRCIPDLDMYD